MTEKLTPDAQEKKQDADTALEHVAEATSVVATVLTVVGFVFPVARVWAFVARNVSNGLNYLTRRKKK